ncbi:MAG: hypothetical protein LBT26_01420 [Clostridiales Family XIII bacterium]|jgi:hypothetical protein|nr:hypothetical protein [Clostridiales Family XIII bacterium]
MREDRNGFIYNNLSDAIMLKRLNEFKLMLAEFGSFFKVAFSDIDCSIPLVYEIYKRIDQRADYYLYFHTDPNRPDKPMEMSQTKEMSLMAFWVLKYKPLSLPVLKAYSLFNQKNCTINEYFAAYCIISYAKEISSRSDIMSYFTPKNIDVLVYSFMHRDISKEAMICYVESLLNVVEY